MDLPGVPGSSGGWKPAAHKRSLVWEHFYTHEERGGSKCKHCGHIFKDSSTTTLNYHLRSKHKIRVGPQPGTGRADELPGSQPAITDHFQSQDQTSEAKMLSQLAAVDGISFHTMANSTTLHRLWKGQGYHIPTCHKTIKRMVVQYSEKAHAELKEELLRQKQSGRRFCLTADEWTSGRNRRYAGVNLHGENISLLGLIRISGSMPAEKGRDLLVKKLQEFDLDLETDILGITTDGARVMKKMGRIMPVEHQVCTLHGLHLAVTDVFYKQKTRHERDSESEQDSEDEERDTEIYTTVVTDLGGNEEEPDYTQVEINDNFAPLINRVRKISRSFRRSPLKNDLLEKKCQEKNIRPKPLMIDTKTRWHSMLAMLKRFLEMQETVREVLLEMDTAFDFPNQDELALLSNIVEALEIVEEGSLELGKDDSDLEKADITFKFMLEELGSLTTPVGRETFSAVKKRISERRKKNLTALLCFLKDPGGYNRMSEESQILQYPTPTDLAKDARTLYSRLFLSRQQEEPEEVEDEEPARKSRKERLADMIQGKHKSRPRSLASTSTPEEVLQSLKTEMHAYVSTGKRPPCLQKLYDALLTLPPTSVAIERAFSTSNMFVSKLRSSMNDDTVNHLMFLRSVLKK